MDAWFPQVKIRLLTQEEINRHDPDNLAFLNINTPEDYPEDLQIPNRWRKCPNWGSCANLASNFSKKFGIIF